MFSLYLMLLPLLEESFAYNDRTDEGSPSLTVGNTRLLTVIDVSTT